VPPAALIAYVLHMVFPYQYPETSMIEGEEEHGSATESEQAEAVIEETKNK
jgi:hypothetical protein